MEILYIEQITERPPVPSNLVNWPEDEGFHGATLTINDDATSDKFLGQIYFQKSLIFAQDHDRADTLEQIKRCGCRGSQAVYPVFSFRTGGL